MIDLALDVMMARAYGEALHKALTNMRVATETRGAPTADELIRAIDYAFDKANSESASVRAAFLRSPTERHGKGDRS